MRLPHRRETGGIKSSQKMKSAFFDCFYVMQSLKKGVHYIFKQELLDWHTMNNIFIYLQN